MKMTIELENKDLLGISETTMVALLHTMQSIATEGMKNVADEKMVDAATDTAADKAEPEAEKPVEAPTEEVTEDKPKKRRSRKQETKTEEVVDGKLKADEPKEEAQEAEPEAEKPVEAPTEDVVEDKPTITQDELKHYCAEQCKAHPGFSSKLRKLMNDEFKVEKLSAVKPEDYQKFYDRVAELVKEL